MPKTFEMDTKNLEKYYCINLILKTAQQISITNPRSLPRSSSIIYLSFKDIPIKNYIKILKTKLVLIMWFDRINIPDQAQQQHTFIIKLTIKFFETDSICFLIFY